ncbi:MAG TPA: hypothetical protein VF395_18930 [Polyangiaceae bacterium]
MKRRRALLILGVVLVLATLGAGYHRYQGARAASRYQAPVFVDAPAGPRAPSAELLGVRVGTSRLGDVKALTTAWGVSCADRSVRTLMNELRDKKRAQIEEAKAHGTPDAVTGASILTRHTARDDNPQIRFSCEEAQSARLVDRARMPPSNGRLLYVFDDERSPLRHVSYQRNHPAWDAALADFIATRDALAARLGKVQESETGTGASRVSDGPGTSDAPVPKYGRRLAEFRFSDLVATVSVANLGGRGYSVGETLEVPLPIRADAPAR